MENLLTPSLRTNQVLVTPRSESSSTGAYRLNLNLALGDDLVEQKVEAIGIRVLTNTMAIVMQRASTTSSGAKHARSQKRRLIAANQNLHRVLDVHFVAPPVNPALFRQLAAEGCNLIISVISCTKSNDVRPGCVTHNGYVGPRRDSRLCATKWTSSTRCRF